ncbi:MAG: hypothetical protein WAT09_16680 [Paracoccaceae bacterium]
MRVPFLILLLAASPAPADDSLTRTQTPMNAAEFDAYVTGKTLTYSQYDYTFGVEEYLPGRYVAWRPTGEDCQYGKWYEKAGLICFTYDYSSAEHCWTFWQEGGGLKALAIEDPPDAALSEVAQTADGLHCPAPDVGV